MFNILNKFTFDQNSDLLITNDDTEIEVFFRNAKFAIEKKINKIDIARSYGYGIIRRGGAEKVFINKIPLRHWTPDTSIILDYVYKVSEGDDFIGHQKQLYAR